RSPARARFLLGSTAIIDSAVVTALLANFIYLFDPFGGHGPTAHGPLTVPTFAPTADGLVFTIDTANSEASFTIQEVLLGDTKTVVGTTNQIAGQILVNTRHPSQSQVGLIRVDLSTVVTDDPFRNLALQKRIFETGNPANQFATFTPTTLTGLPSSP